MQRCALALPGGPWHFSFAWGQLENLSFFIETMCWVPMVSQAQSSGLLEHSLKIYGVTRKSCLNFITLTTKSPLLSDNRACLIEIYRGNCNKTQG